MTATSSSGWATRGSSTASSRSAGSSPTRAAAGSPTRGSSPSRTARRSSTTAPSRASAGQPFAVWILDNVGAFGVKRLKAERRRAIPGVLAYCRKVFERAGAVRLQLRPGRLGALLPGDDGEGVPLPGPGPVRAGPARRHGERQPIPDLHLPVRVALAAGAREAPHPGASGLHARQRATRHVGVTAPGGGLFAPGRSHHRGHPSPGRPIQPGGRSRDRRGHRERIPDERQAAVATGGSVRPWFARIQGRGRLRLPPDGLGRRPPRHRGPGGQLLRRVPVLPRPIGGRPGTGSRSCP